jgi:poly(A) polymerase
MNKAEEAGRAVVKRLDEVGYRALFAGGCVRDTLLGRKANDYDVATSATPKQVRKAFRRTLRIGEQFGIVIVLMGEEQVEVATFRADGDYSDGRRPETVEYIDDPAVDAARRDFTINGLFFDPLSGETFDFVDGVADLRRGLVRAIGDPAKRFDEDKLRILRAPRFACMLGFRIEERTAAEAKARAKEIETAKVSPERIRVELEKILSYPGRAHGIQLCSELGILEVILPEGAAAPEQSCRALAALAPGANKRLAWGALLGHVSGKVADAALRRLKLSNKDREGVVALLRDLQAARSLGDLRVGDQKRLLRAHDGDLEELVRVTAIAGDGDLESYRYLCARRAAFAADTSIAGLNAKPLIGGRDLQAAGLKPGPAFGRVLPAVELAQLEGRVTTAAEALALALELARGV